LPRNKQAEADVEYLARIADANEISAGAEVDRGSPTRPRVSRSRRRASIAHRGEIEARERIARAAAAEQIAVANAEEQVVRARFDSRIAVDDRLA
jgi:hypothetical protein